MNFLIVDDDFGCRRGMAMTLQTAYPESATFEARSMADAIALLDAVEAVDIVLLDLTLDDSQGIETLEQMKQWCEGNECHARIVVVSAAADYVDTLVARCIDECATGFIEKGVPEEEFLEAIALTLAGGMYLGPGRRRASGARAVPHLAEPDTVVLTRRERQVLELLTLGLSYKQIARRLASDESSNTSISDHTVRVHVQRMAWKVKSAIGPSDDGLSAKAAVLTAFAGNRFKPHQG